MRCYKMVGVLLVVLLVFSPSVVRAQLAVYDAANHQANIFTGFQQFLNTLEAVFHSTQWTLDLTGYDDHGLGGLKDDVGELFALIREGEQLLWDIRSLQTQITRLFGLDGAPDNTAVLRDRLGEIRRWRQERLTQAQRIQTIQHTAIRIVERVVSAIDRILTIAGDKQGLQQVQSHLSNLNHQSTQTGVLIAAFQQVELDEPQEQLMVQESITRIHETLIVDWPGN